MRTGTVPPTSQITGHPRGTPTPDRHLAIDIALLVAVAAIFSGAMLVARAWAGPLQTTPPISLGIGVLPKYALFSFARGASAYVIALVFTIIYGKAAAASPRIERVMLPVLDVLQSIPVLSFMPGFVIALVGLFPHTNFGLELACVLSIFTSQVWNMTFSFHASLKSIPGEFVDAARINGFGPMKRLFGVELPSAMNGLVWNSMMSMAGGWFFLTIVEAFTLDGREFRLPGLGSYMATAVAAGDGKHMAAAIVAMITMIVAVDQIVWRPVVAWSHRFKNEDTAGGDVPHSWVYNLMRRSRFAAWLRRRRRAPETTASVASAAPRPGVTAMIATVAADTRRRRRVGLIATWACGLGAAVIGAIGLAGLARILGGLEGSDWVRVAGGLGSTALRVAGCLVAGALWTVPVGILIGRSPRLSRIMQPIIQIAASFPAPMLFPIVVPALLHAGVMSNAIATGLMLLGTQWYILFNVAAGAAAIPQDLLEAASVFRLPFRRRLLTVYFGTIFPFLLTGLVTAAGGAWNASIVSEAVPYPGGRMEVTGVGSLIASAFENGNHALLAAATLGLSVALVLINRVIWRPLQRLAARRFALNR